MPTLATINFSTNIEATALVLDPSGSGLRTNARVFENILNTCTTLNYATAVDGIATQVYNYISGAPTTGLKVAPSNWGGGGAVPGTYGTATPIQANVNYVQCIIAIDNVQSPDYTTPRYYGTKFRSGLATPGSDAEAFVQPREYRGGFCLGPNDYSSQATLKALFLAELKKAVEAANYA